jgi:hypothetical protein
MGCCAQRFDFTDSKFSSNHSETIPETLNRVSHESENSKKFQDFLSKKNWKSLSTLVKVTEKPNEFLFPEKSLNVDSIGAQSVSVLQKNLDFSNKSHFSIFISIIPELVSNLQSTEKSLQLNSFDLIESSLDFLSESVIFHVVRLGIFEKISLVKERNTAIFAFKLFENRERIQRIFLKHHGIFIICLCLINFPKEVDAVLNATLNLIMVNYNQDKEGKINVYNCKQVFCKQIFAYFDQCQSSIKETFLMSYEDFILHHHGENLT